MGNLYAMRRVLTNIARAGLDFVLPPRCGGCGMVIEQNHTLCARCWAKLDFISAPYCTCCGYPFELLPENNSFSGEIIQPNSYQEDGDSQTNTLLCPNCIARQPAFDHARSALIYDESSRDYILRFKHGDGTDLTPLLVRWLLRAGDDLFANADLLVPVPLHRSRLRKRRFNQAALLAAGLSKQTGIDWNGLLLTRPRKTQSLAGLGASARQREVGHAFDINARQARQAGLEGASVILIDDVWTSGATSNACIRTLRKKGAKQVNLLTVARVIR